MKQPKPKEITNPKSKDCDVKKSDKTPNKFVKFDRRVRDDKFRGDKRQLKSPKNDSAFYTKYKMLSDNAARIAFNHRNGSAIQCIYGTSTINENVDPLIVIPYVPIPGRSINKASGINVAAEAAYKVLNRKYRGSPSARYQAADLGIAQFAIMDFYLSLAQAERIYGLCQEARVNQRQVPRELVFSLGFDYNDISENLADFRAHLNAIIVRAQVLCLVKGYPFMDHHLFLLSNIFKDKDTERANYFSYSKPGYWLWTPTKFATGSALSWTNNRCSQFLKFTVGPTKYVPIQTAADVEYNLNTQLNALLNDSDIDAICADILALFENSGEGELLKLSFLPDGYIVDPIFSQDALYQWHNTVFPISLPSSTNSRTVAGNCTDVGIRMATPYPTSVLPAGETGTNHKGLFIYQLDDCIRFDAVYGSGNLTQIQEGTMVTYGTTTHGTVCVTMPIIDTDKLNPTSDEVIEMTRQTSIWIDHGPVSSGGNNYYYNALATIGSTLFLGMLVYLFKTPGAYSIDSNGDYSWGSGGFTADSYTNIGSPDAHVQKYDWHPIFFGSNYLYADLDNYRGIDFSVLYPIHDAALLSEFHNPISDILIKDI